MESRQYVRWTKEALIKRIHALEAEIQKQRVETEVRSSSKERGEEERSPHPSLTTAAPTSPENPPVNPPSPPPKKPSKKKGRTIDPTKYSTRLVALKLAYMGKAYAGFEFQASASLSTIEEELWKALVRACLIFPHDPGQVRFEDWEYSKCGRTDRGVSALGQVVTIRMRSNRPVGEKVDGEGEREGEDEEIYEEEKEKKKVRKKIFDDITDEINYCKVLNRLLPADIRILAWCPHPPANFSARHNCRERQYRYFFTQPAFVPMPHWLEKKSNSARPPVKDGWLDIAAMRTAAKKFEGLHDFRNFCKVDPGKLISNFHRRIFECDVVEVADAQTVLSFLDDPEMQPFGKFSSEEGVSKVYYMHVRGSAFLWHQIRCMVAVLFAVGQGLEQPDVIDALLDVEANPTRPNYNLANEVPLVLWNCIFPKEDNDFHRDGEVSQERQKDDALDWHYVGSENALHQHGATGLLDDAWARWRGRKMDEILAAQFLDVVARRRVELARQNPVLVSATQRAFEGADQARLVGKYQGVLMKPRLPAPEETYDREARRKGFKDAEAWRLARWGNRENRTEDGNGDRNGDMMKEEGPDDGSTSS